MKYKYIIWDWNGTLLDDVRPCLESVNDMLAERNMAPMDMKRYKEIIGVPIRKFYEKAFDLEKEDYNEILRQFNEGYLRHLTDYGLAEGIIPVLELFREKGFTQLIVSSSNNEQLQMNVRKYGVSEYFDAILGAEGFLAESKVERAKDYIRNHGDGKVIVIGDLEHDSDMAKEIGADCILVTWGHEKEERLSDSGAVIVDRAEEIPDYIM